MDFLEHQASKRGGAGKRSWPRNERLDHKYINKRNRFLLQVIKIVLSIFGDISSQKFCEHSPLVGSFVFV